MSNEHQLGTHIQTGDGSWGTAAIITSRSLGLQVAPRAIVGGTHTAAGVTPTVGQFLDAANNEYSIGTVPAGMTALMYNGAPLTYTNNNDGTAASVWVTPQHQVIIAYQGTTGGENIILNPAIAAAQIIADIGVYEGQTPAAETDALTFAKQVATIAGQQGYSLANIFVTGHSLGGIEAEYVAQQTGVGGIAFESTGLPVDTTQGSGSNFVNIVTDGDPVGNYSSDIQGEQPFAPAYVHGGGTLPHYGNIVVIGREPDQTALTASVAKWGDGNIFDQLGVLGNLAGELLTFHLPGVQAQDLGIKLNPDIPIIDTLGVNGGVPVFQVSNDSISQLIAAASAHGNLLPG